jgi:uncharacterized protein (UPF0332 family)
MDGKVDHKAKQEHIEHFRHNEKFLDVVITASPNSFFDWKITVCFYSALHLVRAFLVTKGVEHVDSHHTTLNCLDPNAEKVPAIHLPIADLYRPYSHLYLLSRKARYDGFLHRKEFEETQQDNLEEAMVSLQKIKDALANQGFVVKHPKPSKKAKEAASDAPSSAL